MDLKKEYLEISEKREKIIDRIHELEEDSHVREYLELTKQNNSLYYKELQAYTSMKEDEYDNCNHLLVCSEKDYDPYEGRSDRYYGCVKCGLNNNVLKNGFNNDAEWLPPQQKIMYNYLRKQYLFGKKIGVICDLELAKAIYSKIIETHPDISDAKAIKYFKVALHYIRTVKVNDERKISRAKRLSLRKDFNNWD